jgi:hypothetical protein
MTQKGSHTWDLITDYHRCQKCGYIIESRQAFQRDDKGAWFKSIICERCGNQFVINKLCKPSFGPLIGDPQPIEIDWEP